MLANDGTGRFHEVGPELGAAFATPDVGRGLAVGDYDNDGDLDFFVVNNNRDAQLFRNDGGAAAGHWVTIKLHGTRSNRDGIGARVRVKPGGAGRVQVNEVRAGSSYLSQSDGRLHFGLGAATRIEEIAIRWPSGAVQALHDVPADQILTIVEPRDR
jgi:hypothetical protein